MNNVAKLGMLAATGAVAVAAPAVAKTGPTHPSHPAHPAHPSNSHRCSVHNIAYVASGTLVTWAATGTDGTYSGTVTIHVTRADHHAAAAKGSDVTYTLSGARARFGKGANPPAPPPAIVPRSPSSPRPARPRRARAWSPCGRSRSSPLKR